MSTGLHDDKCPHLQDPQIQAVRQGAVGVQAVAQALCVRAPQRQVVHQPLHLSHVRQVVRHQLGTVM